MTSCHDHDHDQSHDHGGKNCGHGSILGHGHGHTAVQALRLAFFLNVVFVGVEVAGAIWTNSIAIWSDAFHDLGDSLSLGLAWGLQTLSQRQPDHRFTYGYRRLSLLGAVITAAVLLVGMGFVLWESGHRLFHPMEVNGQRVVLIAIVGILFNGIAAWNLHRGSSLNEQLAGWHLWEDVLGWLAVLVGGAAIASGFPSWIDPALSIAISLFVIWNVVRNLMQVIQVLLQAAPAGFDAGEFAAKLKQIPGVVDSHSTQTWSLDGEHHVISTHLVLDAAVERAEVVAVLQAVHEMLRRMQFQHITVEVELEGEACTTRLFPGHSS